MQIKVSIIVPVFNGADNLRKHLGNVISQTLNDIEIILINDASNDDTLKVMNDAKAQFPDKIRVIDSPVNGGAGGARNLGLEIATGEYVGFVDCDDVIETTMYEKLYVAAHGAGTTEAGETTAHGADTTGAGETTTRGADVADCGYYYQAGDNAIIHTADDMTGEMDVVKRKKHIVSGGYIVSKIFRREFLTEAFRAYDDSTVFFRKNCILEDADFLGVVFSKMKTVVNVKEVLYYYLDAADSSSKTTNPEKYLANIKNAMTAIYDRCSSLPEYDSLKEAFEYELLAMYSNGLVMLLSDYVSKISGVVNSTEIDSISSQASLKIAELVSLKNKLVTLGYDNRYVREKIQSGDIDVMMMADRDVSELLSCF